MLIQEIYPAGQFLPGLVNLRLGSVILKSPHLSAPPAVLFGPQLHHKICSEVAKPEELCFQ